MSNIVKVSVQNVDATENKLYELNLNKSLEENIQDICKLFDTPYSTTVYGLKIISSNDGKLLYMYVSSDNFKDIKDAYFLQLVYGLDYYIKRIFEHISGDFKEKSFQDLHELSLDSEFIKELVKSDKHRKLLDIFTNQTLNDFEATACLKTIVHLFQKLYINNIDAPFLAKIIDFCKNRTHNELIKYTLSVLHKILCHRDPNFNGWKEEILKEISIGELLQFIRKRESSDLQFGALLVINTMIKTCKGEKRNQLIKEINIKSNRESIYQNIIVSNTVDKAMARELYIFQTYLLR